MDLSVTPAPRRRRLPAWAWLGVALLASGVCVRLGLWQWQRGQAREAQWQHFTRGGAAVLELGDEPTAGAAPYQAVRATGRLDGAHQFLLDNRSYHGRPGYEVLTPLVRAHAATLLVDRGWVPFSGSRRSLPDVALGAGADADTSLTGRLGELPSRGLALGHAAPAGPWPKVTAFPDMAELAAALGAPLEPRLLLLDPGAGPGYVRDWQPPGMAPMRHFAYAIQWWSFAALALFLWGLLAYRNRPGARTP
ncbi:MAG: SURF1 family protein [Proteobacteria bacterium]|nr:SURF1 family protein [Pseudomonadota bacterium]